MQKSIPRHLRSHSHQIFVEQLRFLDSCSKFETRIRDQEMDMDHQSQADNYHDDDSEPTGDDGNSYEEDSDSDVYHDDEIIETFEELRQSNYYPFPLKIFALLFFPVNSPHPVVCCLPYQMCCIIELNFISIRVTEVSPFS